MAGCFTALTNIIAKLTSHSDLYRSTIYYFLSAFIILLMSLSGYFVMHRMEFYKYWSQVNKEITKVQETINNNNNNNNRKKTIPYGKIIKKIWILLFCIWINFFSTLSIFPVYQLGVKPCRLDFFIGEEWFQDVVTFLTFNFCVLIGNTLPKIIKRVINFFLLFL